MDCSKYQIISTSGFHRFVIGKYNGPNLLHCAINVYKGDPNGFDFKRLTNNFNMLQLSVKEFGTDLDYMWYGEGDKNSDGFNRGKYILVKSTDDMFVWVYDAFIGYSTSNRLFINGKGISFSKWIKMDNDKRYELYLRNIN